MNKVYVVVEGPTEERFVKQTVYPHLASLGVLVIPTLIKTKYQAGGAPYKGGIVPYGRLKKDLLRLLNDSSATLVTTMLDFYGLPRSFPGRDSIPSGTCYQRVAYVEEEFFKDINTPRFLPYLALHEFEAMLFSSPAIMSQMFPESNVERQLVHLRSQVNHPEEINDHPDTCPSNRIRTLLSQYQKALHGPLIAQRIGLEQIRAECPHFAEWLAKLEKLN